MHRTLQTQELLPMIFSNLDQSSADQLHAALTCKTWLDAGLDVLWKRIKNRRLKRLLSLIYPLQDIDGRPGWDRTALAFAPEALNWTTFLSYAKRVRYVSLTQHGVLYHPTLWTEIEARKPCRDLFPRVKSVSFYLYRELGSPPIDPNLCLDGILSAIILVLSPSVCNVNWNVFPSVPIAVRRVGRRLATTFPEALKFGDAVPAAIMSRIPLLALETIRLGPARATGITAMLRKLPAITELRLHVDKINSALWEAVSSLSHLRTLELNAEEGVDGNLGSQDLPPELKSITIGRIGLDGWLKIFSKSRHSLSITAVEGKQISHPARVRLESKHPTQIILTLLATNFPNLSTLDITIDEGTGSHGDGSSRAYPISLGGLRGLKEIRLKLPASVYIAKEEVLKILTSSPELCDFVLDNNQPNMMASPESWLPLTVLDEFSRHCPKIKNIVVQAVIGPTPVITDRSVRTLRSLDNLDMCYRLATGHELNVKSTALYLSSRLPRRTNIFAWDNGYNGGTSDGWADVEELMQLLYQFEENISGEREERKESRPID